MEKTNIEAIRDAEALLNFKLVDDEPKIREYVDRKGKKWQDVSEYFGIKEYGGQKIEFIGGSKERNT